jgi:hypothetical protein
MGTERRRERRHPFIASAEISDEKETARTCTRVTDLSLHGCYVEMTDPFPQGTTVLIEIHTETEFLETHATVAYLEAKEGMGLTFVEMPPYFSGVLDKWLLQSSEREAN